MVVDQNALPLAKMEEGINKNEGAEGLEQSYNPHLDRTDQRDTFVPFFIVRHFETDMAVLRYGAASGVRMPPGLKIK